jgi:hypothetical protein
MHALDNSAFDAPVSEFAAGLRSLYEIVGPIRLQCVEESVFVNELRIRFDRIVEQSISLSSELLRHAVGGITFNQQLDEAEIRTLVRLLSGPAGAPHPRTALQEALATAGMSSVQLHPVFRFRITGEEVGDVRPQFREVYLASAATVADVFANLGANRLPSPLPVRKLVHQLIDSTGDESPIVLALASDSTLPSFARHTLMVTNLALVIGRGLGLSDGALADLGIAAIFHDVGFSLKESGYSVPFERHTRAGLKILLRQRGFHRGKVRRLLTVAQHHHGVGTPRDTPTLYARIVHIADDYDTLTRYRPGRGPLISPADALARMAAQAGVAYDTLLLQVFVNSVGRFPPGTIMTLADGRTVVSVSAVRSPQTFALPLCRVLRNADGSDAPADEIIDLAHGGQVAKVHHPVA